MAGYFLDDVGLGLGIGPERRNLRLHDPADVGFDLEADGSQQLGDAATCQIGTEKMVDTRGAKAHHRSNR